MALPIEHQIQCSSGPAKTNKRPNDQAKKLPTPGSIADIEDTHKTERKERSSRVVYNPDKCKIRQEKTPLVQTIKLQRKTGTAVALTFVATANTVRHRHI